jgi:hypothetical protein
MKSKQSLTGRVDAVTVSVRRSRPRAGTTHTYVLNGTYMRDVLVDGKWVTVSVSVPVAMRAA